MSSPIPPDPYVALGVSKDVDISAIRTAHRKLVLKHHPDRIQDPALKERGKNEFQKIQQAYELLSDPVLRQRYDDKIKLAELRKEAMMRDPPARSYPMRPAPTSAREYREEDRTFYEERRPRETPREAPRESSKDSYFDNRETFEEPQRASARKYPEYERRSTPTKVSERPERTPKANWSAAYTAVNFGLRVKKEAEKTKSKINESKREVRDREKRSARQEKVERKTAYVVSEDESDSDTASRVTSSTIRPSKSSARHPRERERESEISSNRSPRISRNSSYSDDDDSDVGSHVTSRKWEQYHDRTKEYIERASGQRKPEFVRSASGQFWQTKSGSENERRPTSSKGRRSYDEAPQRPSMPTQSSAPSNLKSHVEERMPKPHRAATNSFSPREREPDHRKQMPGFARSFTLPTPRSTSSKKDTAPVKGSGLKHGETQDSGYGSSSSPHTPELRDDSPVRRPKLASSKSTRYQIVEPSSDDDVRSRVKVLDDDSDQRRRHRHHSPEPERRESERKREKADRERPERPRINTERSKTSRDPTEMPSMRRTESARYDARSPRESPRERTSPPLSRHNSNRDKLFMEQSPERESSQYRYTPREKVNVRPPYGEAKYSQYGRDSPDRRDYDSYAPHSRFQDGIRNPGSRRPSVQGY